MSDISKVNVGGTLYNLKDSGAVRPQNLDVITSGITDGDPNILPYDPNKVGGYQPGMYCLNGIGAKKCIEATSDPPGAFDSTKWVDLTLWYLSENSGNDVHLSIQDGKLQATFHVEDYDPDKVDGYEVGDLCIVSENNTDVLKVCIDDTPKPAGVYNSIYWETY